MKKYLISIFLLTLPLLAHAQSDRNSIQLRVDPAYFSPNKDGLQDQIFFYPVAKSTVGLLRWTLDILSVPHHKRMVRLSGVGFPALIKWDGLDKKGQTVPDGSYMARFSAEGRSHTLIAEENFSTDRSAPVVNLTLSTGVFDRSSLENGRITMLPRVTDNSTVDHWLLQVIDASGRTAYVWWSSGTVSDVAWDGRGRSTGVLVPPGLYRVLFQAWDKAGNESRPAYADLQVNVTPREMLEHALHLVQVNETPLGLIVQLDAARIFKTTRKRIELSPEGEALLREVAILANAYPDAAVKLDGYAWGKKKSVQDKDLSSVYAWRTYSFLSKTGSVRASRINVRGRGHSAMFDRRSAGVPLLRNGVEVILEGNPPW